MPKCLFTKKCKNLKSRDFFLGYLQNRTANPAYLAAFICPASTNCNGISISWIFLAIWKMVSTVGKDFLCYSNTLDLLFFIRSMLYRDSNCPTFFIPWGSGKQCCCMASTALVLLGSACLQEVLLCVSHSFLDWLCMGIVCICFL